LVQKHDDERPKEFRQGIRVGAILGAVGMLLLALVARMLLG
jgi:hypothetical protein